jgi:ABC-type multidrug transport system ATPase subunit
LSVCLRVAGLTKHYGALRALDGVSFEVRQGEILGLIGPNGSGKTTLFECIGGMLPFDAGDIHGPVAPGEPLAQHLFYLPDAIAPWPSQTVDWALQFVAGYFNAPAGLRDRAIAALSIEPLLQRAIGHLSKGQRKRVLLAIGVLTSRPVLLADEPFDGLDLRQTREVAGALRTFARDGHTLVLSIHQIADAARVCDRFVLLSNGTVRGEGTLDEVTAFASQRRGERIDGLEEAFLALT